MWEKFVTYEYISHPSIHPWYPYLPSIDLWLVNSNVSHSLNLRAFKLMYKYTTWDNLQLRLFYTLKCKMIYNPFQHLGSLHTRDWEPVTIPLQALSLVEKADTFQVRFTLYLRDQRSMWMQYGCKVHMDYYMASNGPCFMATWTIFKTRLLEVGLTQNHENMALRTLTTVDLFYFIMCEDPHE